MDILSKQLVQLGFGIQDYRLSQYSLPVGKQVFINKAELVYRMDDDVLTIIIFQHAEPVNGLSNAFNDVIWLLDMIKHFQLPVRRIKTCAQPLRRKGMPTLSQQRLIAFYKRYFKAATLECKDDVEWIYIDTKHYQTSAKHIF